MVGVTANVLSAAAAAVMTIRLRDIDLSGTLMMMGVPSDRFVAHSCSQVLSLG
jgi:hypothetical protein